MTFNNIEIPTNSYANPAPNWQIFDGVNIGVIHDGQNRYLILKNLNTAVRFIEPNTSVTDKAAIIGYNTSNVYFLNFVKNQVRNIPTSGTSINESYINLNEFNSYQTSALIGTNLTQNVFNARCGNVDNSTVVVGGFLSNPSPGLTVAGTTVSDGDMCYMYSTDNGATFQGPIFPFYDETLDQFYNGHPINVLFINDNWVWYIVRNFGASQGSNIVFDQTLGVDLAADVKFDPYLETPTASLANYQLPYVFFDNKLFFQDTNKTGYFTFNFEDDTIAFSTLANISSIVQVGSVLRITTLDSCTPVEISAVGTVANNIITTFNVQGAPFTLQITPGQVLIEEEGNYNSPLYNGLINSDHNVQPSELI